MDKFMEVPALGAEIATTDGVASAGIRAHYMILFDTKINSAAAAAIVTDGHDILHKSLLFL